MSSQSQLFNAKVACDELQRIKHRYRNAIEKELGPSEGIKFDWRINNVQSWITAINPWATTDNDKPAAMNDHAEISKTLNKNIADLRAEFHTEVEDLKTEINKLKSHHARSNKGHQGRNVQDQWTGVDRLSARIETSTIDDGSLNIALSRTSTNESGEQLRREHGATRNCRVAEYDTGSEVDQDKFKNIVLPQSWTLPTYSYSGRTNESLEDWSRKVVQLFTHCEIRKSAWVPLAIENLKGDALDYWKWKSLQLGNDISWADFINAMEYRKPPFYLQKPYCAPDPRNRV